MRRGVRLFEVSVSAPSMPSAAANAASLAICERLQAEWRRSTAGDALTLSGQDPQWLRHTWQACGRDELKQLGRGHFVIEATIRGASCAAGFSFGRQRDFLVPLTPSHAPSPDTALHLQLEVHASSGAWAFRVNGALMPRSTRDAAITNAADIINGELALIARMPGQVTFSGFRVKPLDERCKLSVVMTCHRFQQRLRASLRHWCHQTLPAGALEILIVNPQSPDGTHELIDSVRRTWPHAGVRELPVSADIACNKGAMINHGVRASRGEWIWLTDADCLFPPDCVSAVLAHVESRPRALFYGERRHLTPSQTDAVLTGAVDAIAHFARLSATAVGRAPDHVAWGYTQIVHRSVLERIPYRELAETFAKTDTLFAFECQQRQIHPSRVPGLVCLHLDHPFSWRGVSAFL